MGIFCIFAELNEVTPTLGSTLVGCIGTLLTLWIKNKFSKHKDKKNGFQSIIDANTAYREEVKKDLKNAKEEVLLCKSIIEKLESKIKSLESEILNLKEKFIHKNNYEAND